MAMSLSLASTTSFPVPKKLSTKKKRVNKYIYIIRLMCGAFLFDYTWIRVLSGCHTQTSQTAKRSFSGKRLIYRYAYVHIHDVLNPYVIYWINTSRESIKTKNIQTRSAITDDGFVSNVHLYLFLSYRLGSYSKA